MTVRAPGEWPSRRLTFDASQGPRPSFDLEWLVTNGLGGYASGTVGGGLTRRYHGLLIAALPAPLGRMLYLCQLRATITIDGHEWLLDHENTSALSARNVLRLAEFRLDAGLPVWRYEAGNVVVEKRVLMAHRHNTTAITYALEGTARAELRLQPLLQVRSHDAQVGQVRPEGMHVVEVPQGYDITIPGGIPDMHWHVQGADARHAFDNPEEAHLEYLMERDRGYAHNGSVWIPGTVSLTLHEGSEAVFVVSTESWERLEAVGAADIRSAEMQRRAKLLQRAGDVDDSFEAELALAADQFIIVPVSRMVEVARTQAHGEAVHTIIAGYHWFTDWGRDSMISLEGLTLCTGRPQEAAGILRAFAHHVRDGLIPNFFPEGEQAGVYHTADATLWFVHALDRYVRASGDAAMLAELLPTIDDIIDHHLAGTRFGIRVEKDGLLTQGADHYQLTWMDAKVGDWVVTPRRGKAVEINALWYNALRVAEQWMRDAGRTDAADKCARAADAAYGSFNQRFWNDKTRQLFDVVDGEAGNDPLSRPNQVLAISLPFPVLAPERWEAVLEATRTALLTPVGLRSLASGSPDYHHRYFGDLRSRDAAYHQGTVWAWLIGPFVDAWLKVHPTGHLEARAMLVGFVSHLSHAGVGSISEVFDAEDPFTPRGCIAQAWSVAEVLRAWVATSRRPGADG
ncbi:MAG: amylo-alpha-1,6-glucosidase [Acidobacteriota bacterium]